MKPLLVLMVLAWIPLAIGATGCSSTPDDPGSAEGGPGAAPPPVEGITGVPVRVEWRNLNPRRQDAPLGLINHSSPEMKQFLSAKPGVYENVKPVDDEVMALLLEQLRKSGFYEHAVKGLSLDSFRVAEGQHGVICVHKGADSYALLFSPGMVGTAVPEVYRDCKYAILEVHRRTMYLAPSAPQDPDRVFRVPTGRPPRR